jgi:hypothetical protein
MSIEARAFDVTALRSRASIGAIAVVDSNVCKRTLTNSDPQAGQVDTWEYTSFSAGDVIGGTITLGDYAIRVQYTVLSGDTNVTGAATKLKQALEAEPTIGGILSISQASGVLTLTGRSPYVSWVSSDTETDMTITAVSAAAAAAAIPVGRFLTIAAATSPATGVPIGLQGCRLPATGKVPSRKDTWTYSGSYANSKSIGIFVKFRGQVYNATHTTATDLATSLGALATEINGVLPANSVVADGSAGTTLILTSEVPGEALESWVDLGTSALEAAVVSESKGSGLSALFLGVSVRSYDEAASTFEASQSEYAPNAGVKAVQKGLVWVEAPSGYAGEYTDIYVGVTTANAGKFFIAASGADRCLVPRTVAKAIGGDASVMLVEFGAVS